MEINSWEDFDIYFTLNEKLKLLKNELNRTKRKIIVNQFIKYHLMDNNPYDTKYFWVNDEHVREFSDRLYSKMLHYEYVKSTIFNIQNEINQTETNSKKRKVKGSLNKTLDTANAGDNEEEGCVENNNIPTNSLQSLSGFCNYEYDGEYYIEKSGGVAEGHDVGFLLYSGERPQGVRRNIGTDNHPDYEVEEGEDDEEEEGEDDEEEEGENNEEEEGELDEDEEGELDEDEEGELDEDEEGELDEEGDPDEEEEGEGDPDEDEDINTMNWVNSTDNLKKNFSFPLIPSFLLDLFIEKSGKRP